MPYHDSVSVSFAAGHRLLGYAGKCASPHGHGFRAEVIVTAGAPDALGLVIDFVDLKAAAREFIDREWDHAFLVNVKDEVLLTALRTVPEAKIAIIDGNPSAEAMAKVLFDHLRARLGAVVSAVRIWESDTQYAEYEG